MTYTCLTAVILGVLGLSLMVYLARNPLEERLALQRLIFARENLLRLVDQDLGAAQGARLAEALQRADERVNARILLLGRRGAVIADSRATGDSTLSFSPLQLRQERGALRDSQGRMWLYVSRQLDNGLYLVLAAPRPARIASLLNVLVNILGDELLKPFLQAGLIALVLALVLALFMARWISAPLQRMAEAARAVAGGQYRPIPPGGPREVQALGQAFNEMAARVQASQQSQRDFVANVSHDLKTPLTSIQGFSQAILDGTATSEEDIKQAAGVIYGEASRMHRLVVDLLDLARLDAGTMEFQRAPLNLSALLQQVIERFTPQAGNAQVDLQLDLEPLPTIIADGDRLAQVFTNLVDNAIKYTPPGGKVRLHATPLADGVQVRVTDSGPGIPAEELSRIFERFYQLDKSRRGGGDRGAGLGLAIAHEIVNAHGGRLYAHSQPGQGSEFVVELPLARPDDTTLAMRPKTPSQQGKGAL